MKRVETLGAVTDFFIRMNMPRLESLCPTKSISSNPVVLIGRSVSK